MVFVLFWEWFASSQEGVDIFEKLYVLALFFATLDITPKFRGKTYFVY